MRPIHLYQVYDTVSQSIMGPIIPAHHQAKAIRDFTDVLRDAKTILGQHPDDFELRYVGIQDEETGTIDPIMGTPEAVLTGRQWREMQEAAQTHAEQQLRVS